MALFWTKECVGIRYYLKGPMFSINQTLFIKGLSFSLNSRNLFQLREHFEGSYLSIKNKIQKIIHL